MKVKVAAVAVVLLCVLVTMSCDNSQGLLIHADEELVVSTSFSSEQLSDIRYGIGEILNPQTVTMTRSEVCQAEDSLKLFLAPLLAEGRRIRAQLEIKDDDRNAAQAIGSMTDEQLVAFAFCLNVMAVQEQGETRANGNDYLFCLGDAIFGYGCGASMVSAGIKGVSKSVAKKVALKCAGKVLGGYVSIAWGVWDYYRCIED